MFKPERTTPPADPPSAAALAAGIPSHPHEALPMPAAFLPEDANPTRQHAIGSQQCRWIIADEDAGAEALMCGAPAERRRPFCAAHCAIAYVKPPEDEASKAPDDAAAEDEAADGRDEHEPDEDAEQEAAE